jgi:hypothetical protein
MKTFFKRASQYILFWVFLVLLLEIGGYTINWIIDRNQEMPTAILIFAMIGATAVGVLVFLIYRSVNRRLR